MAEQKTQTEAKKKTKAVNLPKPKYHFLSRIVGQQRIEGQVLDGPELDVLLNSWLEDYDLKSVDYMGKFHDQSNTVLGHQYGYHLILKEA